MILVLSKPADGCADAIQEPIHRAAECSTGTCRDTEAGGVDAGMPMSCIVSAVAVLFPSHKLHQVGYACAPLAVSRQRLLYISFSLGMQESEAVASAVRKIPTTADGQGEDAMSFVSS